MRPRCLWLGVAAGAAFVLTDLAVPRTPHMTVVSATYGGNCGAPSGNVSAAVAKLCDGRARCDYEVDMGRLGDPVSQCAKDFRVTWRCAIEEAVRISLTPPEGGQSVVTLRCGGEGPSRIEILAVMNHGSDADEALRSAIRGSTIADASTTLSCP